MLTMHQSGLNGVRTIEPERLEQVIRSGRRVIIVDVRPKETYAAGHIEGARSIPMKHLVHREAELTPYRALLVIVVSQHGGRARSAAVALSISGFTDVRALEGGMERWEDLGFPMMVSSSIPPSLSQVRMS